MLLVRGLLFAETGIVGPEPAINDTTSLSHQEALQPAMADAPMRRRATLGDDGRSLRDNEAHGPYPPTMQASSCDVWECWLGAR